jgi:alkanesulfonate monooxygenase SsuD/methylene tetrahydromethanopterin reductase-like flavin-dependent oxidoreductase (luciferase family)
VRFFSFHLMPYPALPPDYDGPAWVTCPNSLFDPEVGHAIYNRYLDELVAAERLGFDGVCVNEHHQNAYGLMPSPNLMAAILARQTERVRIAVVGNALPLYDPPTRVAEEFAMIDCISGGRLIAGMVVGGGPEYYSFSINPTQARERFQEAHDLIKRAWTEPGPFEFIGKHYKLRYVNPWPRPLQKPHPEIWIPGIGSLETLEFVARNRYAYMGIPYFHISVFERMFDMMRQACEKEGYQADPLQLGWLVPIFVADTDAEARRLYEEHFWYFVRRLLPGINISPPGYTSLRSVENILKGAPSFALNLQSWDQVVEGTYAVVGSPETVCELLSEKLARLGAGNLLGLFQLGTLPGEATSQSLEAFATEVMPKLRAQFPHAQAAPGAVA